MSVSYSPYQLPIREDWLAQRSEPPLEPGLSIIDAHHHLLMHPTDPAGNYLIPEFLQDLASGHRIESTVYVQARTAYLATGPTELQPVGEVAFARCASLEAGFRSQGRHRACSALVGHADLTLGDKLPAVLEALASASDGLLRGIRNNTAWHEDSRIQSNTVRAPQGLLLDSSFVAGAKALAQAGLALDVWVYQTQLGEALSLARQCPGLTLVIDHVGGPLGIGPHENHKAESFAAWRQAMASLARQPNVMVKLGGLGMKSTGTTLHSRELPPASQALAEFWRPWIETAIELFGPERCMFESNFPIDKGSCSYGVLWNAFKRLTASCSAAEKQALYQLTARRVYGLDIPG